jgi:UDP-N-acetylglucosamine--N-acetylmuramyl-(pentapeptide) pyrophosphoryl-undecaprenol N-acetylglucosamine transferase
MNATIPGADIVDAAERPKVVLAGGGTAGHTSPLIATADALRRLRPDVAITCIGTARGLETRVIPASGYRLELIPPVPLPRQVSGDLLRLPLRLRRAVRAARDIIVGVGADVVVGYGGYVSMPVYLAARGAKVPLIVHEQNALPGIANQVGARFCTRLVATSFPDTPLPHAHFIGLPIRHAISTLDRAARRAEARQAFGLRPDLPTLLVTGGSQGARRLNQTMGLVARDLVDAGIQVLHVRGHQGEVALPELPPDAPYVVVPFVEQMDLAFATADLTVCRAGASSVTEAAATGLPAVFVPLPIGNGEQALNARSVVEAGGGILIDDSSFTAQWARAELPALLHDPVRLERMGAAASSLIRRDADEVLARLVFAIWRRSVEQRCLRRPSDRRWRSRRREGSR